MATDERDPDWWTPEMMSAAQAYGRTLYESQLGYGERVKLIFDAASVVPKARADAAEQLAQTRREELDAQRKRLVQERDAAEKRVRELEGLEPWAARRNAIVLFHREREARANADAKLATALNMLGKLIADGERAIQTLEGS